MKPRTLLAWPLVSLAVFLLARQCWGPREEGVSPSSDAPRGMAADAPQVNQLDVVTAAAELEIESATDHWVSLDSAGVNSVDRRPAEAADKEWQAFKRTTFNPFRAVAHYFMKTDPADLFRNKVLNPFDVYIPPGSRGSFEKAYEAYRASTYRVRDQIGEVHGREVSWAISGGLATPATIDMLPEERRNRIAAIAPRRAESLDGEIDDVIRAEISKYLLSQGVQVSTRDGKLFVIEERHMPRSRKLQAAYRDLRYVSCTEVAAWFSAMGTLPPGSNATISDLIEEGVYGKKR